MKQKIGIAGIYLLGALAAQAGNYTVIKKRFLRRMLLLEGTFLVYIL